MTMAFVWGGLCLVTESADMLCKKYTQLLIFHDENTIFAAVSF
jgi:hypothetical protein